MKSREFVTSRELELITSVAKSTWDKRRVTGDTPPYVKIGRSVRYHLPTAIEWLKNHSRRSTSAEDATVQSVSPCIADGDRPQTYQASTADAAPSRSSALDAHHEDNYSPDIRRCEDRQKSPRRRNRS